MWFLFKSIGFDNRKDVRDLSLEIRVGGRDRRKGGRV